MEDILTLNNLISFISLTLMEVVLGIDNIIFISILTARLPAHQQDKGRMIGLVLALLIRIILLFALSWLIGLNKAIFTIFDFGVTGRDLILIGGGLFLIYKSTSEIHAKLEGSEEHTKNIKLLTLQSAIFQIIMLDIVFSFDSILTAIGLVDEVYIMIAAVIIAMGVMIASAKTISEFINKHPTLKMLALSFLLLIGVLLLVEGFHAHVPKGYIYFAIFFSLSVELLNMRLRKKTKPVQLKKDVADVKLGNEGQ